MMTKTMRKILVIAIRIAFLLLILQPNLCDARQAARKRGRPFRNRALKQGKAHVSSKSKGADFSNTQGTLGRVGSQEQDYETISGRASCKRRKGSGKGKASGKGGQISTCSPSSQPSLSPTATFSPSFTPSESPSEKPSGTPSTSPSSFPSKSPTSAPSSSPSNDPSATPSTEPSSFPSRFPSLSPSTNPSNEPSINPSEQPSLSPSKEPSFSPSSTPSAAPSSSPSDPPSAKPSSLPSMVPSVTPSGRPSDDPTYSPSTNPSQNPTISVEPSISTAPTALVYETKSVDSELQSSCISPPPSETGGGTLNEDQRLVFQYLLFVTGTTPENEKDNIVNIMEDQIHRGLARRFLTCNPAQDRDSFHVWSISSKPPDFISSDPCDSNLVEETDPAPPVGSKCILVQAELNMEVYFPRMRRRHLRPLSTTSADQQVILESGEYLNAAMNQGKFIDGDNILQNRFLAFIVEGEVHTTIDRGVMNIAGVNGQVMNEPKKSEAGGHMTLVAAASICLVLVAIIVSHRRKKRSDALQKHINALSRVSDSENYDFDRGAHIVGDLDGSSLGWFNDDLQYGTCLQERDISKRSASVFSLDRQHDVHKCASAFCEICLRQKNPTFVASDSLNTPDILEDLRNGFSNSKEISTSSPDTVVL